MSWSTARWQPGDALFFHANTLHCSAANLSDKQPQPAHLLLQQAATTPTRTITTRATRTLDNVTDEAVLAAGERVADAAERWFLEEGKDETTEARRAG